MRSVLRNIASIRAVGLGVGMAVTGCASSRDEASYTAPPNYGAMYTPLVVQAVRGNSNPNESGVVQASATEPSSAPTAVPSHDVVHLTLDAALGYALENNPTLTAIRTQRGIAAAGVVIANQYPFNPVLQVFELNANPNRGQHLDNRQFHEYTTRIDLELRGQRGIRRAGAAATVARTDWDIAVQELTIAIATIRAHNTAVYRQKRLDLQDETIQLTEKVYEQTKKLADLGRLKAADVIVARTNLSAARAQRTQSETAVAVARADLRRLLGTNDDGFTIEGKLLLPLPTTDQSQLTQLALQVRPDVNSRRMMVAEAQALHRLEVANRYGNPSAGLAFEYDDSRTAYIGLWLMTPIPVVNTRKGEIQQRKAAVTRAIADVQQFETQASLDVQAALTRLNAAVKWADSYDKEVLPSLRKAREETEQLFEANEPGVDILKVIGVQQNYLQALGLSLDAQFEVSQAHADLAMAVGDPTLALGVYRPSKNPQPITPQQPTQPAPGDNNAQPIPFPAALPATGSDGVAPRRMPEVR